MDLRGRKQKRLQAQLSSQRELIANMVSVLERMSAQLNSIANILVSQNEVNKAVGGQLDTLTDTVETIGKRE